MAIVINLKDADGTECICEGSSSWLDHWEINKGISAIYCRVCSTKTDLKGTHVKKWEMPNGRLYIIPCCKTCFDKEGELNIWSYNELVPAQCEPLK
jgi:hypothetical protein